MYQRYVKRILDFILSLAATIVLAIPMGIIALWIKADSPGPVFFKQRRVGKGDIPREAPSARGLPRSGWGETLPKVQLW